MEQKPSVGRIVHYKLTAIDAGRIEYDRELRGSSPVAVGTLPVRAGNPVREGVVVPLIIVCVWPNEFGAGKPGVNGQAFLDGNDSLWITSAGEGTEPGQWSWPPRV